MNVRLRLKGNFTAPVSLKSRAVALNTMHGLIEGYENVIGARVDAVAARTAAARTKTSI